MSNTPSLLGCPFCGGMATAKPIDSVPGWHHVTALHSDCFYKPAQDKMLLNDEHLAAWNRRTPQPVVREPLTREQALKIVEANPDAMCAIRMTEAAHGITQGGGSNAVIEALSGVQALSAAPVEVADAMADSQYLAGVCAGWNAANADDPNDALRKLHESRAGYLKPLDTARKQGESHDKT